MTILLLLELLNIVTFSWMRAQDASKCADLVVLKEDPCSNVVNYVIAGLLNQADTVFHAYKDDFEGTVIAVNFRSTGWEPRRAAESIRIDIALRCLDRGLNNSAGTSSNRPEVRIWAVSVGGQVANWVDTLASAGTVKVVLINPCTSPICLKPNFQGYETLAQGLCTILGEHLLGWVSLLPIIPMSGVDATAPGRNWEYSPILLADQLVAITAGRQPVSAPRADVVILSERDQFLDNQMIRKLYMLTPDNYIITIDADHAGTAVYADQYRVAFRRATEILSVDG